MTLTTRVKVYHWTPLENVSSILSEGLRRCSRRRGRLVLCCCREERLAFWRESTADRHRQPRRGLALFAALVWQRDIVHGYEGEEIVTADVPPCRVCRVEPETMEERQ